MSNLENFRAEVSEWLEENCPPSMKTPMVEDEVVWGGRNAVYKNPESKIWLDKTYIIRTRTSDERDYAGGGIPKLAIFGCTSAVYSQMAEVRQKRQVIWLRAMLSCLALPLLGHFWTRL